MKPKVPTYTCDKCGETVPCIAARNGHEFWPPMTCGDCGADVCDSCQPGGRGARCLNCEEAIEEEQSKLAAALRLADAAVIEAAEELADTREGSCGEMESLLNLRELVRARRKAKALAEQAKEASRG